MLIRIIREPSIADALEAWRLSRDKNALTPIDTVCKIDAPVIEMPSALLNFEDFTILEREIICSLRNHVVWARTSRVDDPTEFTTPELFKVYEHDRWREHMRQAKVQGIAQDEWRQWLPLVAHTSWTQRISLRDLARLAIYFGYLQNKAVWHKLAARLGQAQYEIVKVMTEMLGGRVAYDILNNMKLAKFLHEGRMPISNSHRTMGNFISVNTTVSVALRAQIIRHRELQFTDDFWSLINTSELPYLQLKHKVNMQLVARKDIWQAVLSKRSCWIAQADLWQPLIKVFGFSPPLPCTDSMHCPYEADARARLEPGKDPNPPCPVFCNLYKVPKEPHMAAMMPEAKRRGEFWVAEAQR